MLILGNKKLRQTEVVVVKLGNQVVKIPFSSGSLKEMKMEQVKIEQVKNDPHFNKYLPIYKKFFGCLIMPYADPLSADQDSRDLIRQYFFEAFRVSDAWPKLALNDLVNFGFIDFVKKYLIDDYNYWLDYLNNQRLLAASAHGDFCPENILTAANKLYFIDWSRYRKNSSRYFDLIDYYIFLNKDSGWSWTQKWLAESAVDRSEILGIKIKRSYWLAYAVWKVGEELAVLKLRNKLNQQKINKYVNFIKLAKQAI